MISASESQEIFDDIFRTILVQFMILFCTIHIVKGVHCFQVPVYTFIIITIIIIITIFILVCIYISNILIEQLV